jgi:hypothetical protein
MTENIKIRRNPVEKYQTKLKRSFSAFCLLAAPFPNKILPFEIPQILHHIPEQHKKKEHERNTRRPSQKAPKIAPMRSGFAHNLSSTTDKLISGTSLQRNPWKDVLLDHPPMLIAVMTLVELPPPPWIRFLSTTQHLPHKIFKQSTATTSNSRIMKKTSNKGLSSSKAAAKTDNGGKAKAVKAKKSETGKTKAAKVKGNNKTKAANKGEAKNQLQLGGKAKAATSTGKRSAMR